MKKEKVFQHFENRILIRYTLLDAHSVTTLRLRPFLAFRSVEECTHENAGANRHYDVIDNGIKTRLYPGYPELMMQLNKNNEFVFEPNWYRGIEYQKEQELGYDYKEDLYVPGYFEFNIKKGESVVFAAGLSELKSTQLKKIFDYEYDVHAPRTNFQTCLVNAAHQFHYERDGETYIIAGYPWFKCRARDMFVSLPGLTLAIDEVSYYEKCMKTAEKAIQDFIGGKKSSIKMFEMDKPDVLLWAVWCIQQYCKFVGMEKGIQKYGQLLRDIMNWLIAGKHPNLYVHENGLVYASGRDKAITWMNSSQNGQPIVPRSGYIVEFNALWYNALMFSANVCRTMNDAAEAESLEKLAVKAQESFIDTFLNDYGYLLDYVDGTMIDWSVRPNMIFTCAFDYSPLNAKQKKGVLDMCTKELLTPKGLRTLSPKSGGYNPMYVGPQIQRDYAYHQGTAWPWLAGFYLEACLKVFGYSRMSFVERQLVGYEEELFYHCIGTLPEVFDGNPPFHGRGAMSFAMNVAEIMRVVKLLDKYIMD